MVHFSMLLVHRGRAEVIRRRPTGDSGSWHRSPCRPQHESDGIQVSYATLPAALTSVTDLCRARPARWPDHLLVIEQRSLASSACVQSDMHRGTGRSASDLCAVYRIMSRLSCQSSPELQSWL